MVIFSDIYMKTMRIVSIDLRLSMRVNGLEYKRIFSLVNSRIPALETEDRWNNIVIDRGRPCSVHHLTRGAGFWKLRRWGRMLIHTSVFTTNI